MATIAVLGAGMMGSALCVPLVDRGHEVRLIGTHLDGDIIASLRKSRVHPKLNYELPAAIHPYAIEEIDEALSGVEQVALGVSSEGVRWAIEQLAPRLIDAVPLFMITKGLEWRGGALKVLPDVVHAGLPERLRDRISPAAIAGPCIAGELARRVPTCVVLAGRDASALERIAAEIRTDYYHIWTSTDVVGVEVCAALKNAYAMGVAIPAGMHTARGGEPGSVAMHNYESAVFAQAVVEMQRIVAALGGDARSAAGLAGAGDLDVTNNGGRTGRFGRWLGTGIGVRAAVEKMHGATLECLEILRVMRAAADELDRRGDLPLASVPLLDHLCRVVQEGAAPDVPFERFFGA